MDMPTLLQPFCDWLAGVIDDEGVYPIPVVSRDRDGKVTMAAMDVEAMDVLEYVWRQITCEQVAELIFGLDRSTKPGQGTEFSDVLTCGHWFSGFHESWNAAWKPFVINYQNEPRIVRPPDFANEFWNAKILSELQSCCPPFRIKTTKTKATA